MCQKCIKYVTSFDVHPILGVKKLISLSEYISTTIGPFEARCCCKKPWNVEGKTEGKQGRKERGRKRN